MKLRIRESDWAPFSSTLRANRELETAGIILARQVNGGETLVAEKLSAVPLNGYTIRERDRLQITPVALNGLVRQARLNGLSVLTAHTHPGTEEPWFSQADDVGDARLMPSFYIQSPGPHGSIVLAGDSARVAARAWRQDAEPEHVDVRVVGRGLSLISSVRSPSSSEWFDRQVLALGQHGQASLERLHVGVVGLGGTGSVCLAQLAHLGVGEITLVDADIVESTNVSRIIGASVQDAGRTPKVDVACRYLESLGLGPAVRVLRGDLGREVDVEQLASCDVILSCVDRFSPRVLLNRLAYQSVIPVIDMGSAFRVDHAGRVSSSAGRVVVVGPGRPCLGCWGHIDARHVHIESLSESEMEDRRREGYIEGADVQQPSIIPFNTLVAGAALVELLRLVTEFSGSEDPPNRLAFDFESGSVRRNRLAADSDCRICGGGNGAPCRRPPSDSDG